MTLLASGKSHRIAIAEGLIVKKAAIGNTVEVTGVVCADGGNQGRTFILLKDLTRTNPPQDPLIAHYTFDQDHGNIAKDSSSDGNNAKLVNNPTHVPGKIGTAVCFDGKKSYLALPDLGRQPALTIAVWLNMNSMGGDAWSSSILHCDGWNLGDLHFQIPCVSGNVQASLNGAADVKSTFTFRDNLKTWVHVVYTYDTKAGKALLYVNGKLEGSAGVGEGRPVNLTHAKVGSWGGDSRFFDGAMDDLRIYDRARSPLRRSPRSVNAAAALWAIGLCCAAPQRGFVSAKPAETWEHALVSGNGKCGAMVMGQPLDETIILNHARLFMPLNQPLPPADTASHLTEIRKMIADGQYQRAADYVVELSHKEGYGGKRWTDPFIPAFDLRVRMAAKGQVREYQRSVDFQTGVAAVGWRDDRGEFCRRLFVSRPDDVVALQIAGPARGAVDCELQLDQRPTQGTGGWAPEWKFKNGIKDVSIAAADGFLTYRSSFKRTWPGSLQGYEARPRVVAKGGKAVVEGEKIVVRGADEVLVLLRIELLNDFEKSQIPAMKEGLSRIEAGFPALLARDAKVHGGIFNRVRLDLGGSAADRALTSEELDRGIGGRQAVPGAVGKGVRRLSLQRHFQQRRVVSEPARHLERHLGAPWSADFTLNGNVQSAIAADLSANMAECLEPFFRYLEAHIDESRVNARRLYGCRGIHVASRASSHGLNNHFDGIWPMTFWTAGAAWDAQFFYDYYLYTGDREFLRNLALPFMKEAAPFYEDFLVEGPDGKFLFSPSYSPENTPRNSRSQACINATMDISAAKELLTNLSAACEELKTDAEGVKRWRAMLAKMPDYAINADGAVKEWTTPLLEDNYAHRHCSHLYAYSTTCRRRLPATRS